MTTYELKSNVVAHFAAIFKALPRRRSVVHMALDVELRGGALAVRVAGGRPLDCGKHGRAEIVALAAELIRRGHRVLLVEEACGFGYGLHRRLRELGVEAMVVATEALNGRRKTDKRDARKLLEQLHDFDVNGNRHALRPTLVPTPEQQKRRRLCRMRTQLIKVRNILEAQGRGLMFDFDFHDVPQGWWGPRKWRKLCEKLCDHDPWLLEMIEHHQEMLLAQQRRIREVEAQIAEESRYEASAAVKGLGETTFEALRREVMDWSRFNNRKQIGSYIGCCPSEFSSGGRQKLGAIDRQGNRRMRTLLVEAVWRLRMWNPGWRGFKKFPHVFGPDATARGATRKKAVVACARLLAVDLWRLETGRATLADLGLRAAQPQGPSAA